MSLAKVSGYRAETLKSFVSASNFRRTRLFLLQCFEAFYEFFLGMFFSCGSISELEEERVKLIVHDLLCQFQELSREECSLDDFRVNAALTIADKLPQFYETFTAFMENATKLQDTIKFWYSFLFEDCFPYLSLFIAIRYRNWDMRTGSVKNLAAMYRAFDRPKNSFPSTYMTYVAKLPDCILSKLREGGFAMRLSSTDWHGVALDECHEMEINKDAKLAVVRPTPDKMQFTSHYLPFRSKIIKNLKEQLFPERQKHKTIQCYTATTRDKAVQVNARIMVDFLKSHAEFFNSREIRGLWNFLEWLKQHLIKHMISSTSGQLAKKPSTIW